MDIAARGTYLDRILEAHRARVAADSRSLEQLLDEARAVAQPQRGFVAALTAADGLAVIAEVKRRSPSKGDLNAGLDPARLAVEYQTGGATCLSVLTDEPHFGGSPADLRSARTATQLPVLRKDFTVGPKDVCDARLMGADAVLLIVAALDDRELADLAALATEVGLDVLFEVHDEAELDRAMSCKPSVVGVNQRDLYTFKVDRMRAVRVGRHIPDRVVRVAESGVQGPDDARELAAAGFDAVLVGESLVTCGDPRRAVGALRHAAQGPQPR